MMTDHLQGETESTTEDSGDQGDTSDSHHAEVELSDRAGSSGRRGGGRGAGAGGAGAAALGAGVGDLALANVGTLDDALGVVLGEVAAVEGLGGLEVEATTDFLESGERDAGGC